METFTIEEEIIKISSPFYKSTGKEIDVFYHAYNNKIPLLLKGPTGTGKSRLVEYMAYKLDKKLITISCHEETSSTDLIGRFVIKGAETVWIDGPLTIAIKEGYLLYLDEIAEARPDIIVAIHSLTDHRRELYIDKLGETISAHPDFMLIASFNPGYQKGYKELKPSTRQRFSAFSFDYPNEEIETEIVIGEAGVDKSIALSLVKLGNKIRNLSELGLTETVSTRLLVNAAKLIKSKLPVRLAAKTAIAEPLTDEKETLEALYDLCELML